MIELHDMYKFNDIKMNNMLELIRMKNYMEQYHKEISDYVIKKSISADQTQSIRKTYNAINIFNILYLVIILIYCIKKINQNLINKFIKY